MTVMHLRPKKMTEIPINLKNDWNDPKSFKKKKTINDQNTS